MFKRLDIAQLTTALIGYLKPLGLPADYNALTPDERRTVREEYVRLQDGKCYYCEHLLTGPPAKRIRVMPVTITLFPTGFFEHPVHLHHSHITGLTIGAVHNVCNAVMWEYNGV